eukprot:11645699-Alexandrium_andersonii.AAC.1
MASFVAAICTPKPGIFFTRTSSGPQNTETNPRAFCGVRGRLPARGVNPALELLRLPRLSGVGGSEVPIPSFARPRLRPGLPVCGARGDCLLYTSPSPRD